MSELDDAMSALRAADAAGNVEDARRLATIVKQLSSQTQPDAHEETPQAPDRIGRTAMGPRLPTPVAPTGRPGLGSQFYKGFTQEFIPALKGEPAQPTGYLGRIAEAGRQMRPEVPTLEDYSRQMENIPETKGLAEHVARRFGTELAANVRNAAALMLMAYASPAPAAIPVAARTGQGFVDAVKTVPLALAKFSEMIKAAPTAAAIGEVLATLGSSIGGAGANQMFPGDETAESVGQIAGAVVPGVAGVGASYLPMGRLVKAGFQAGKSAISGTWDAVSESGGLKRVIESPGIIGQKIKDKLQEATQGKAREQAIRALSEPFSKIMAQPETAQALSESDQIKRALGPTFKPTTAETSRSPTLLKTQAELAENLSGVSFDEEVFRRRRNLQAVREYANRVAPNPEGGDVEMVVDVGKRRVTDLSETIASAKKTTQESGLREAEDLSTINKADVGGTIRGKIIAAKDLARKAVAEKAKELNIDDEEIDPNIFVDFAKRVKDSYGNPRMFEDRSNIPDVVDVIKNYKHKVETPESQTTFRDIFGVEEKISSPGTSQNKITFRDIRDLRERVSDDLLDSIGAANPSRKKIRTLVLLKKDLDDMLDGLADTDIGSRYKQFRDFYKTEYIDKFEKGAVYKSLRPKTTGEYVTADERVADLFWADKNVSGPRQWKKVFGDNPDAKKTMQNVILDDMRRETVRNGEIDSKLLAAWTRKNQENLNEFPEIKIIAENKSIAINAISSRMSTLNQRAQNIEQSILAKITRRFSEKPEQYIDSAISDPRVMHQLWNASVSQGLPPSVLQRAVWDRIITRSADDPDKMSALIEANARSLRRVFTPRHIESLRIIVKGIEISQAAPPVSGQGIAGENIIEQARRQVGTGVPQILSRVFAAVSGRTSKRFVISELLARYGIHTSESEFNAILKEALWNEDVASAISNVIKSAETNQFKALSPMAANRLNTWVLNLGIVSREEENK